MKRFDKKFLSSREIAAASVSIPVRFQDVDAAGLVYFARFFEYFHTAYEVLLTSAGHPLAEVISAKRWAAPLRHAEADYLSPARFGDVLLVELVAAAVEESEISLGFRLSEAGDRARVLALGQTVHTFVELPSFVRTKVPEALVTALSGVAVAEES